jgi:hypothetical protein
MELQKLDALLGSAIAGAGRFALVTGEPGITSAVKAAEILMEAEELPVEWGSIASWNCLDFHLENRTADGSASTCCAS